MCGCRLCSDASHLQDMYGIHRTQWLHDSLLPKLTHGHTGLVFCNPAVGYLPGSLPRAAGEPAGLLVWSEGDESLPWAKLVQHAASIVPQKM